MVEYFYFLNDKDFFRAIWSVALLQKYFDILIFLHDHQL